MCPSQAPLRDRARGHFLNRRALGTAPPFYRRPFPRLEAGRRFLVAPGNLPETIGNFPEASRTFQKPSRISSEFRSGRNTVFLQLRNSDEILEGFWNFQKASGRFPGTFTKFWKLSRTPRKLSRGFLPASRTGRVFWGRLKRCPWAMVQGEDADPGGPSVHAPSRFPCVPVGVTTKAVSVQPK